MGYPVGAIQLVAALGCCGLLVHGVFDFNLHVPANAAWFAVCAAQRDLRDSELPGRAMSTRVLAWNGVKPAGRVLSAKGEPTS